MSEEKVYIVFKDLYEGREVEGVYRSLEAAQARYPDVQWKQHEWLAHEEGPPTWDALLAWLDCNIEEHELVGEGE